jgi:hypothetical protein
MCGLCSVTTFANFCHSCARRRHWHSAYTVYKPVFSATVYSFTVLLILQLGRFVMHWSALLGGCYATLTNVPCPVIRSL